MIINKFMHSFYKMRKYKLNPLECISNIYSDMIDENDKMLLNDIILYYFNNDTLLSINTYYRYYNDKNLISWIVSYSNIILNHENKKILDCNVKVNSFIESIYDICGIVDIVGISNNEIIHKLCELNINKFYNDKFKLSNYDVLINDIDNFDYIFYDFPIGIHNMTHAACCDKIKNLKIRGTNADALLLQLIMMSLNKNGHAYLIVPDSILYGDSIQQVITRKYLVENFNIKNIIQLDETFYKIKGTKNSILHFINDTKTTHIQFSKLSIDLNLSHIIDINYNKILSQNYSLFYKHYIDKVDITLIYKSILNYCSIHNNINSINSNNVISLNKYYKDESSIILGLNNNSEIFISCNNLYTFHYVYTIIITNINSYTSGKLLKFDIEKIKNIQIPDLSESQQDIINNYITISNNIMLQNNEKIVMYQKLQNCLLDTLPIPNVLLLDITNITFDYNSNLIGLIKNGITAGTVYENNNDKLNTNSYYLKITNTNYELKFIYYYLKYLEPSIKDNCKLSKQPLLIQSYLAKIKIPNVNKDVQNEIILQCNYFEDNINKFINDNYNIKNKNIINMILKLY
jgi:hypothetical protein